MYFMPIMHIELRDNRVESKREREYSTSTLRRVADPIEDPKLEGTREHCNLPHPHTQP